MKFDARKSRALWEMQEDIVKKIDNLLDGIRIAENLYPKWVSHLFGKSEKIERIDFKLKILKKMLKMFYFSTESIMFDNMSVETENELNLCRKGYIREIKKILDSLEDICTDAYDILNCEVHGYILRLERL